MKNILVAVDGSSASVPVVAAAVEIARPLQAKIRLLEVIRRVSEVPASGLLLAPISAAPAADTVARVRGFLEDLEQEKIPPEHRDGCMVEVGAPADVICRVARAYEADLVVIGAHRYGRVARALGTNAARVVNGIDRPVLVVRPAPGAAEATMGSDDGEDSLYAITTTVGDANGQRERDWRRAAG